MSAVDERSQDYRREAELYRQAAEDALQQLDWCIGYFHGTNKNAIARALSKNRSYIRRHLMGRREQQTPTEADEASHRE
ncbi:MAG: hypothetical protein ACRDOJ_12495 [Nocardioidaceae bacterium]